jgi:hypothetical protein
MFVAVKKFGFFKPTPRKGAKIVWFEKGQELDAQMVKTRKLVQKGFAVQAQAV